MKERNKLSKERNKTTGITPSLKRGDIIYADLSPSVGSEQGGVRPVIVLQNNKGNAYSPTVIVAPISTKTKRLFIPTHVQIQNRFLKSKSIIMLEQIRTIDYSRIHLPVLGRADSITMNKVDRAIEISLGLNDSFLNSK